MVRDINKNLTGVREEKQGCERQYNKELRQEQEEKQRFEQRH